MAPPELWARLAYPVSMLVTMSIAAIAVEAEIGATLTMAVVSATCLLFVWIGEYAQPFQVSWHPTLKDNYLPDIGVFLVNNVLLQSPIVQILVATAAIRFAGGGLGIWPHHWPLWLQIPIALVIAEFGTYWWHRACHESPWLWKFHQLHHSPSRLYWLNATRFHYLDVTILQVCAVLPLLFLGASETVILFMTLFSIFHGYWQHGNTRQRLGPLNYIFSSAELHRWHHNNNAAISNNNYGSNLIVWDHLFGSFYWPEQGYGDAGGSKISLIGIDNLHYPGNRSPFRQMLYPFRPVPKEEPGGH